jgi:hypothetical protein
MRLFHTHQLMKKKSIVGKLAARTETRIDMGLEMKVRISLILWSPRKWFPAGECCCVGYLGSREMRPQLDVSNTRVHVMVCHEIQTSPFPATPTRSCLARKHLQDDSIQSICLLCFEEVVRDLLICVKARSFLCTAHLLHIIQLFTTRPTQAGCACAYLLSIP